MCAAVSIKAIHTHELSWLSENRHLESLDVIALDLREADGPVREEFWQRRSPLKSPRLSGSYDEKTLYAIINRYAASRETLLLVTPEMEPVPDYGSAWFKSEDSFESCES